MKLPAAEQRDISTELFHSHPRKGSLWNKARGIISIMFQNDSLTDLKQKIAEYYFKQINYHSVSTKF